MEIINGSPLEQQPSEFREDFDTSIRSELTEEKAEEKDSYNRPVVWVVTGYKITAIYIYPYSSNRSFNYFLIEKHESI